MVEAKRANSSIENMNELLEPFMNLFSEELNGRIAKNHQKARFRTSRRQDNERPKTHRFTLDPMIHGITREELTGSESM
jgi:hypothetical protein